MYVKKMVLVLDYIVDVTADLINLGGVCMIRRVSLSLDSQHFYGDMADIDRRIPQNS